MSGFHHSVAVLPFRCCCGGGALKMLDVKMTDVKLADQCAGHEIAGRENDGPTCRT